MLDPSKPLSRLATGAFAACLALALPVAALATTADPAPASSTSTTPTTVPGASMSSQGYTGTRDVNLAVTFTPRYAGQNVPPLTGELQLRYAADGSVTGAFRQAADGSIFTLSGTTIGPRVFFNVANDLTSFYVDGTLRGDDQTAELLGNAHIGREDYVMSAGSCQTLERDLSILCR